MRFSVIHRTRYTYATPVKESFNEVHLEPVTNEHQTVDSFVLKVLPPPRLRPADPGETRRRSVQLAGGSLYSPSRPRHGGQASR
jgi:hypothetical protein